MRLVCQSSDVDHPLSATLSTCEGVYTDRSVMAISGPPSPGKPGAVRSDESADVVWRESPGSNEVFRATLDRWESPSNGNGRVTLLGTRERLIGVSSASRNAASAFRLVAWLAGGEMSAQLGDATQDSYPCRRSQLRGIARRLGGESAGRAGLAQAVEQAASRTEVFVLPRIPGIDQYLVALRHGLLSALANQTSSEAALADVSRQWDQITDSLGRAAQRRAYLQHLNLAEGAK
jgi:hypothetical protein